MNYQLLAGRAGNPLVSRETTSFAGMLAGIARKARQRADMEVLSEVRVTIERGIEGDYRGSLKPWGSRKRQISIMERCDWEAATAELGVVIPWEQRRANLMIDGINLPQRIGARLRIGPDVVLEITTECDPCERMEDIAPGLFTALAADWRGGACARVLAEGTIRVGDAVGIEE